MILNYFLLAFRNIIKQRGYSIVNMLGLAVGLASALLILLYVKDEMTFDRMHPKASSTYRIGYWAQTPNGDVEAYPFAPAGWDNYIKATYPGVSEIGSYSSEGMPTSIQYRPADKIVLTEEIIWAEPGINNILYFPVLKGDANNPLKDINSIMMTETAAYELFGNDDPIGKVVSVSHEFTTNRQKVDLMVTAVMKDMPSNSHISPKYVANILALKPFTPDLENRLNSAMDAGQNGYWTQSFFVCDDESKIPVIQADLQQKVDEMIKRNNWTVKVKMLVRKITDVHFDKELNWSIQHKSADKTYIYVFISIAIMILVVAGINYINLSTARSASRAREIGLRKTFGGLRIQLFAQFMMESFLLVLMSSLIALLIVFLVLPQFNTLTAKTFTVAHVLNGPMLLIMAGVVVFVTLLAGSYPALFVSKFEPAEVLKGKFAFRKGSNIFRQFLTTLQFIVAVTFLIGTIIVVRQMDLMRNSKLNEAGKQIVSIRFGGFSGPTTNDKFLAFKNSVQQGIETEGVTLANHLPRLDFFGPLNMQFQFPEISEEKMEWYMLNGDYDFPKTFGLNIIAGRDFDHNNLADSNAIILNQSALRSLKLTAEEAIGKTYSRPDIRGYNRDTTLAPLTGLVIGVVEDFPYRSMHNKIDPLAISPRPHFVDRIIHVRLSPSKMGEKILHLEQAWKKIFPEYGFDYWFVDEEFGRMYENETKVAELTEKFSWLAILITCVGLYGLASFMSQQRTKEIGIRKTMGASNGQILYLLLNVFGKLLLIASVVAVPVAYFLSSQWLEGFVYRVDLSVMIFGGAVALIAIITLVTVGYESLKASLSNPVKALRHE
jgi:putative ABC transport system permease protein